MVCVTIGDLRFATIAESYRFLRDGGSSRFIPPAWGRRGGYLHRADLLNIAKRRTLRKLADIRAGNLYHVSVVAR